MTCGARISHRVPDQLLHVQLVCALEAGHDGCHWDDTFSREWPFDPIIDARLVARS
jgi:hypothetical protein